MKGVRVGTCMATDGGVCAWRQAGACIEGEGEDMHGGKHAGGTGVVRVCIEQEQEGRALGRRGISSHHVHPPPPHSSPFPSTL